MEDWIRIPLFISEKLGSGRKLLSFPTSPWIWWKEQSVERASRHLLPVDALVTFWSMCLPLHPGAMGGRKLIIGDAVQKITWNSVIGKWVFSGLLLLRDLLKTYLLKLNCKRLFCLFLFLFCFQIEVFFMCLALFSVVSLEDLLCDKLSTFLTVKHHGYTLIHKP